MWWFKYNDFDDFEAKNLLHEIDNHYGFRSCSDIFNPEIILKK
jgi:hypothetical protein